MGIIFFTSFFEIKYLITILAILAGLLVISTKNPIISVFNLIVLYILVAFYLIHIGIIYLGISYIVVYIGAIAILFLFVIMMIDIEVVERKNNNYLILLFDRNRLWQGIVILYDQSATNTAFIMVILAEISHS